MILSCVFFFNDTATTEIYTLSLHDALPIYELRPDGADRGHYGGEDRRIDHRRSHRSRLVDAEHHLVEIRTPQRSEEHTSELQSRQYLVCRLLLEKKKKINKQIPTYQ